MSHFFGDLNSFLKYFLPTINKHSGEKKYDLGLKLAWETLTLGWRGADKNKFKQEHEFEIPATRVDTGYQVTIWTCPQLLWVVVESY